MKHAKGERLNSGEKWMVVHLKHYFDENKARFGLRDTSVSLTSKALKIGLCTAGSIMAAYNENPDSLDAEPAERGRPAYRVDASLQEKVRAYVRAANLKGQHITLQTVHDYLLEDDETIEKELFHIKTLGRAMIRWGFEFGKGMRTQHLKEKDSVIVARRVYLRKMKENRIDDSEETKKTEVYLDESYVNKNHSNDYVWYHGEDGNLIQKSTGNGDRLVIINAITKEGWVPNAKLIFKSTRKTGDYHGQMNGTLFEKWFETELIPSLPECSLIIMDNASYHKILSENSAPVATSSKIKIKKWLDQHKIAYSKDPLKVELIELLNQHQPAPTYVVDEIAKKHGHEVVRTPPYHPELQPIELCWGVVKNEVARNCDFTMKNLEIQLESAFQKVTSVVCKKMIKKIKKIEDAFWMEDELIEQKNDS